MKKYLIINLGRMGDLIETIPAMVDLKTQDPANHLTLLAAQPFVSLGNDIPVLDQIIPVNLADFMLPKDDHNLLDRYQFLDGFAHQLRANKFDVALNFTHTKTSAALCHILNISDTRGVTLDSKGFQLVRNPWLFYFFVSNLNRPYNQFNLVDIYRRSVGGGESPGNFVFESSPEAENQAQELWHNHRIPADKPVIAFAVGASNHTKRWLPDHFARLAELLHQKLDAHIIILGDKNDQEAAVEVKQGKLQYLTDLTAQTTMRTLGPVLKKCHLLVSNDTGTMHLAAAVGTPTVALVMGTALASETAPYHTRGLVVQSLHVCAPCGYTNLCQDARCRLDITPQAVFRCVETLLSASDGNIPPLPDTPDMAKVQVYRGWFDQNGLFDLQPLIKRPLNQNSLTDMILRRIWLEFLHSPPWEILHNGGVDRWVEPIANLCRQHFELGQVNQLKYQYQTIDRQQLLKPMNYLDQAIQTAKELLAAAQNTPLDIEHVKSLGDRLSHIDRQLEDLGHTQQLLRSFHIYFNLRKGSLSGTNLESQAGETLEIYQSYRLQLLLADRMIEGVLTQISPQPETPELSQSSGTESSIAVEPPSPPSQTIDWDALSTGQGWNQLRHQFLTHMNLKIPIPDQISAHQIHDKQLIIAPQKAAWIVTDRNGATALKLLQNGKTVGECAVELVENEHLPIDRAASTVKHLVADLTSQGFRADIAPVETTLENTPPNLQLFLTRKCNLQCSHCYLSAGAPLPQEISTDDWKRLIDQFTDMDAGNVVTFTGGEPLVHPDFNHIARHAKQRGHKVYLLTNGVALTNPERAKSLIGTVDAVQLSLEGTKAEVHDPIRGKGSFQRALKGLEHLLAADIPVELVFVVLPANLDDLRHNLGDFIAQFHSPQLFAALGVVNFAGRAQNNMDDPPQSLVGQIVDAYPNAKWLRKGSWVSNRIVHGCPLANSIVVDADGKVTTCPYLHYHSHYRIGQMPLTEIASRDRQWHANTIRRSKKCHNCDLKNLPCGGCMVSQTPCSNQILQRAYYRMVYGQ
jgi:radical SAM protein with 4Fe4S-binding SPASM domain